jgi:hypothetical protein
MRYKVKSVNLQRILVEQTYVHHHQAYP